MQAFYRQKIDFYEDATRSNQKKINFMAFCRMLVFLAFGVNVYWYFNGLAPLFLFLGLLFFIIFLVLLGISLGLRDKLLLSQQLLSVNTNELNILEGQSNRFNDGQSFQTGPQESSPGRGGAKQDDLEIFGPNSLYHFLNRTTTIPGSRRLASCLSGPPPATGIIAQCQEAVRTLNRQRDPAQLLTAHGLLAEKKAESIDDITDWLQSPARMLSLSWLRISRWALPLYTLASLYGWILTGNYLPLLLGIAANWSLIRRFKKYISGQHRLIGKKQPLLDQYASILKTFLILDPGSSTQVRALKFTAKRANKEIHRLSQLASVFDQRLNLLVNLVLNSLLIYDIQCMLALEKWKEVNRNECSGWLSCVGEIESLNSLAVFAFNHPSACYPVFAEGQMVIEASQLAHPLIPEKERIANDFRIGRDSQIQLVTGSNMSGKTTFLRTIAVNLILAQSGAPVIAAHFNYSPLQILSSLRTQDSLHEHSSYFLMELNKLQWIIQRLEKGGPAIVLIDEILKGTNSEDKTNGSGQFIRKLLKYNCLGLFATHDLALSKMEDEFPGRISNYCFESQIRDGELIFDYTLKKGVAKNKNASFLMQKMGIIE